jgi:pantothenate kinase
MIVAKSKEVKTGRYISRHIWQNLLKTAIAKKKRDVLPVMLMMSCS